MWQTKIRSLNDGRVQRFSISEEGASLSFDRVLDLWNENAEFRTFYIKLLAQSPFDAFRWETPCVTTDTLDRDFEFVLLRSDALARKIDSGAFAEHFSDTKEVVTFHNLSGDAQLVVPCPVSDNSIYGHLASVIRNAPESQLHQLWQSVADAMRERISDQPVWLSTAGMGVSWLHFRLDDRPKYYGYAPYRTVS